MLFWRIACALRQPDVDSSAQAGPEAGVVDHWSRRLGWLPGAIVFPLVLDLAAGPSGGRCTPHFAVSFTLAGLIGVVFSYLAIEYVAFRALPPARQPGQLLAGAGLGGTAPLDRAVRFLPALGLRGATGRGDPADRARRRADDARFPPARGGTDRRGSGGCGHCGARDKETAGTGGSLAT